MVAGDAQGLKARLVADGLTKLIEYSAPMNLDVLVENHGEGVRCDGAWIAAVVKATPSGSRAADVSLPISLGLVPWATTWPVKSSTTR